MSTDMDKSVRDPARSSAEGTHEPAHADHRRVDVAPYGDPDSRPVPIKCGGPSCEHRVVTYLTDEAVEAGINMWVRKWIEGLGEHRRVRLWFRSRECLKEFLEVHG
jgi:hypothetical protein